MSKKSYCNIPTELDYTGVQIVTPVYNEPIADYKRAMVLANEQPGKNHIVIVG